VPIGSVISQNPVAPTLVPAGSSVNLVVSKGAPPPVPVPDVVGRTQAAAATLITNSGLVVGTVISQSSTTAPSGSVISQEGGV
jgi:serine/threonine-protein kinase